MSMEQQQRIEEQEQNQHFRIASLPRIRNYRFRVP